MLPSYSNSIKVFSSFHNILVHGWKQPLEAPPHPTASQYLFNRPFHSLAGVSISPYLSDAEHICTAAFVCGRQIVISFIVFQQRKATVLINQLHFTLIYQYIIQLFDHTLRNYSFRRALPWHLVRNYSRVQRAFCKRWKKHMCSN